MARTSRKQAFFVPETKNSSIKIALYVRLSNEDNGGKGKDSINNQLELLLDFSKQLEDAEIVETYIDNGHTGTDFERPEWEHMMTDVRTHKINCIIVKDLSRFARNYLEAGDYLEKIFPFMGVRFIAVNDNFDSKNEIFPEKDLITDFKNLANDYYSKDISKKILSAFKAKKEQGHFIGNKAPYGYTVVDNHFIIDKPAADIVRRIFKMKMQGMSSYKIACTLNQENVSSPSKYAMEQGWTKYKNSGDILWQPQAVNRILYNRVYIGDMVQGKYNYSIYSREKHGKKEEETWEIKENTHEAIIEKEVFCQIQIIKERNREVWKKKQGNPGYANVLEGILECGICHHAIRRNKDVRNGKPSYYFYCASAYNYTQSECSTASVVDYKIFDMVLKQIKLQIDLAVEAEALISRMREKCCFSFHYKEKKKRFRNNRSRIKKIYLFKNKYLRGYETGDINKRRIFDRKGEIFKKNFGVGEKAG